MDQIYQLQQQIQKMRQQLSDIAQMTNQLQQFEQSNAAQISRLQQHETNATQQLQRIQQLCNQVNQDLNQVNTITQQLSGTGFGQYGISPQPQAFGYTTTMGQQPASQHMGYSQPMQSGTGFGSRPGSHINLAQSSAEQTGFGIAGQQPMTAQQQYSPYFTGNMQATQAGYSSYHTPPSQIQPQQNVRPNQAMGMQQQSHISPYQYGTS